MACDTLAKLVNEAYQGLGALPKELWEVEDGVRAVIHSLALLKQQSSYSAQNLDLKSYTWEPTARSEALTGPSDLAVPAWVERKWGSNTRPSQDYWADVRVCNLAELESARLWGEWGRCAFHIEDGVMQISFSYDPRDYSYPTHRLWYSPDVQLAEAFNDDAFGLSINKNFFPMVSGMAEMEMISTIQIRLAQQEKPNEVLAKALDKRGTYLEAKVGAWRDRFQHAVYAERGNRKGGRRRTILPRGMRI